MVIFNSITHKQGSAFQWTHADSKFI